MHRTLILVGCAELVTLILLGWEPGLTAPFPGIVLFFTAFALYFWVSGGETLGERPLHGRAMWIVWAFAVAFRIALLPLAPELSDDVYRYLWDGHVQAAGLNPFTYAPAHPALEGLRTPWHGLINHPTVPTIYPPLSQLAFRVIAALGGTVLVAKLLWLVVDLATGVALIAVAKSTGFPPVRVGLLYLWSPLLVVETAWSGHLEVLGLFWLVILLLVLARRPGARPSASGGLLALSALTKFAAAAALPVLVRKVGWQSAAWFGIVCIAIYLPFADAGDALWAGLTTYARDWRFNEGAFLVLELIMPTARAAKVMAALIVVVVVAFTVVRRVPLDRALLWILGTGLLVSPTVHPWYVLWVLPFAALRNARPWILLTGVAFLGYWGLSAYHETGDWPQPAWVRALVWIPVWALLIRDVWTRRRAPVSDLEPV